MTATSMPTTAGTGVSSPTAARASDAFNDNNNDKPVSVSGKQQQREHSVTKMGIPCQQEEEEGVVKAKRNNKHVTTHGNDSSLWLSSTISVSPPSSSSSIIGKGLDKVDNHRKDKAARAKAVPSETSDSSDRMTTTTKPLPPPSKTPKRAGGRLFRSDEIEINHHDMEDDFDEDENNNDNKEKHPVHTDEEDAEEEEEEEEEEEGSTCSSLTPMEGTIFDDNVLLDKGTNDDTAKNENDDDEIARLTRLCEEGKQAASRAASLSSSSSSSSTARTKPPQTTTTSTRPPPLPHIDEEEEEVMDLSNDDKNDDEEEKNQSHKHNGNDQQEENEEQEEDDVEDEDDDDDEEEAEEAVDTTLGWKLATQKNGSVGIDENEEQVRGGNDYDDNDDTPTGLIDKEESSSHSGTSTTSNNDELFRILVHERDALAASLQHLQEQFATFQQESKLQVTQLMHQVTQLQEENQELQSQLFLYQTENAPMEAGTPKETSYQASHSSSALSVSSSSTTIPSQTEGEEEGHIPEEDNHQDTNDSGIKGSDDERKEDGALPILTGTFTEEKSTAANTIATTTLESEEPHQEQPSSSPRHLHNDSSNDNDDETFLSWRHMARERDEFAAENASLKRDLENIMMQLMRLQNSTISAFPASSSPEHEDMGRKSPVNPHLELGKANREDEDAAKLVVDEKEMEMEEAFPDGTFDKPQDKKKNDEEHQREDEEEEDDEPIKEKQEERKDDVLIRVRDLLSSSLGQDNDETRKKKKDKEEIPSGISNSLVEFVAQMEECWRMDASFVPTEAQRQERPRRATKEGNKDKDAKERKQAMVDETPRTMERPSSWASGRSTSYSSTTTTHETPAIQLVTEAQGKTSTTSLTKKEQGNTSAPSTPSGHPERHHLFLSLSSTGSKAHPRQDETPVATPKDEDNDERKKKYLDVTTGPPHSDGAHHHRHSSSNSNAQERTTRMTRKTISTFPGTRNYDSHHLLSSWSQMQKPHEWQDGNTAVPGATRQEEEEDKKYPAETIPTVGEPHSGAAHHPRLSSSSSSSSSSLLSHRRNYFRPVSSSSPSFSGEGNPVDRQEEEEEEGNHQSFNSTTTTTPEALPRGNVNHDMTPRQPLLVPRPEQNDKNEKQDVQSRLDRLAQVVQWGLTQATQLQQFQQQQHQEDDDDDKNSTTGGHASPDSVLVEFSTAESPLAATARPQPRRKRSILHDKSFRETEAMVQSVLARVGRRGNDSGMEDLGAHDAVV